MRVSSSTVQDSTVVSTGEVDARSSFSSSNDVFSMAMINHCLRLQSDLRKWQWTGLAGNDVSCLIGFGVTRGHGRCRL